MRPPCPRGERETQPGAPLVEVEVEVGVAVAVELRPRRSSSRPRGVSTTLVEPVVRIRCPIEEEARTRAALARKGFEPERSLTWLVVREADPDAVNEALAAGGAATRVAVRERLGALLGWLLDHGGRVEGHQAALERLVRKVLEEGGLTGRYAPRDEAALGRAAAALHERLLATGAALVPWGDFVEACCERRPGA